MFGIYAVVLTIVTFVIAFKLVQQFIEPTLRYTSEYLALVLMIIPVWFFGLSRTNLLKIYQVNHYAFLLKQSIMFTIIGAGVLFGLISLFELKSISREVIMIFALINQLCIYSSYILFNQYYMHQRKKGHNLTNIIVIADTENEKFIDNILNHQEWGYKIVLLVTESKRLQELYEKSIKTIRSAASLSNVLKNEIIDEVFYCKSIIVEDEVQHIIHACEEVGVAFRLHSQLLTMSSSKIELKHFDGVPFITYKNTPSNQYALSWKYITDFVISSLVIILWMPFLICIALAIKLTSKGPVIFKQKRVGLHGREFYIYKFRTMMQDAEKMQMKLMDQNEMSGPVFKIKNDPRITRIGRFLRRTSLDELPQFFNVIKGDMSLVGPRPPIMSEVKQYKPWQLRRLSMRPGITCIWQTMPKRNSISFEEWMKMDLQYIDNWSLETDLLLTVKTIRTVFLGSGQ